MILQYIITLYMILIIGGCKQEKRENNLSQAEANKVNFVEEIATKKILKSKKISEDNLIGLINDSDGYTNIRSKPISNSNIIGKIIKGSYFYYNRDVNSNWYPVTTQTGLKGFIHKSRIIKVDSKYLIFLKINLEDPSNFLYDRDTIVKIETLNINTPYFIRDYNYPKIKKVIKSENSISIQENNIQVQIDKKEVAIGDYQIYEKNNFIKVIPEEGYKVFGSIGIPKYEINNIKGDIDNQPFNIKKDKLKYLFEPNLTSVKVYKKSDDEIIIYLRGSSASEGYEVIFIVNRNNLVKRHIYRGF